MPRGLVALVLHAHLPYVRHPEQWELVEERWLYEAIAESYLPLLDMLLRLTDEGIAARIAVSVSPTLAAMLRDPLLAARYQEYAEAQRALVRDEAERARRAGDDERLAVLRFHEERLGRLRDLWAALDGDLVGALGALEAAGALELMASAATHAFLPLVRHIPGAVEAQVALGTESHRLAFGRDPAGFWLPECGWEPSLESALASRGLRYVILETHGVERADPRPRLGVHAPLLTPGGLAAFGRDPECSKQVWSATEGYPADPIYREFFRDLGWERRPDELGRLRPPPGSEALPAGVKLHRITGPIEDKALYRPGAAARRAREQARDFAHRRRDQADRLRHRLDRPPLVVAPFDAELFGHWWFEGPLFLEEVIRRIARGGDGLELVTPSEVLDQGRELQVAAPAASSWGEGGSFQVWLEEEGLWIHRELHRLGRRLDQARGESPEPLGLRRRALTQAVREHLLAQASDWHFLIRAGTAREYAERRARLHLDRVRALLDGLARGEIDEPELSRFEEASPIFPWLDMRHGHKWT